LLLITPSLPPQSPARVLQLRALIAAALGVLPTVAFGQVFVANSGDGTLGSYTLTGLTINASLVAG